MATALITGASSGIGKELARIHASKGGDLVLIARREEKLDAIKRELEAKYAIMVTNIVKDLSKVGSAKAVYDEVKARNIQIDYLFNNAGFGFVGKFHKIPLQKQKEMIDLNISALVELTYLFLPEFIKQGGGKILNTSSTASLVPGPLQAVYYATKAFVTSFGNALAEEYRDKNITVTNLLPGPTDTEFGSISGMGKTKSFSRTATAESAARDGYKAMLDGRLDVISALTFFKLMLMTVPFTPKRILLKIIRKLQEK